MSNNPYQKLNEPLNNSQSRENRVPGYNQPQGYQEQLPYQPQRYQQQHQPPVGQPQFQPVVGQPQFQPVVGQPQYIPYQPVPQVIVIADATVRCPTCSYSGPLYLETQYTAFTWLWCLCLILFCFILAWVPLCSNSCQDKVYRCRNCRTAMQVIPGSCC